MTRFETGKTYETRSIGDHSCIILATIAKRTAKTVQTTEGKTFRVATWHDGSTEYIKPWGSYSMAPMLTAAKVAA